MVCARPAEHGPSQGLGRGGALLHRARKPAAAEWPAAAGATQGQSARRPSAIRADLVRPGRRGGDLLRRLATQPLGHFAAIIPLNCAITSLGVAVIWAMTLTTALPSIGLTSRPSLVASSTKA